MQRFSILVLFIGLSGAALPGCSQKASISEPMTEAQLAEQDKRVQEEERAHFEQARANAMAQPQAGGQ